MNKLIVSLLVLVIVIGGIHFFFSTNDKEDQNTDHITQTLDKEGFVSDEIANSEIEAVDEELGRYTDNVKADIPDDWVVYTPENSGNYVFGPGGYENLVLVTHEDGLDPTQVKVFIYPLSLTDTLEASDKISQIYSESEKVIEEVEINNAIIQKRAFGYANNDCESIQYVHEISETQTGVVEVSGTCPTHSEGYDDLKIQVAESVEFFK